MYWLIGMMGAGKSSAGRIAASRLQLPFQDTDSLVEVSAGMTVAEIFTNQGESEFRRIERDVFASLLDERGVFSAGGGAPMTPENAEVISQGKSVVWLECNLPTLVQRLGNDPKRPLLGTDPGATLQALLETRESSYLDLATERVDTSEKDLDEVADYLVSLWSS